MKKKTGWTLAGMILALTLAVHTTGNAAHADGAYKPSAPWDTGWMFRVRGLAVLPDADGDDIRTINPAGPLVADIDIDDSVVPEIDFTYFFTPNIAAELILAVTPHDVSGTGALLGALGDAWLLPPILTLQYHFTPGGTVQP